MEKEKSQAVSEEDILNLIYELGSIIIDFSFTWSDKLRKDFERVEKHLIKRAEL